MKQSKLILSIILLSSTITTFSQSVNSTYFLNEWSQRTILNASFAPEYGYFSLPVLGGINMSLDASDGISTFLYKNGSDFVSFLNRDVDLETFNSKFVHDFSLNQAMNLNLLSFGFYTPANSFWSFGMNLKQRASLNLPVDMFRLPKLGMQNSSSNSYDLKSLRFELINILQTSLTYSREISPNLRLGVGLKLLVGLPSARFNYSQFDINMADTRYEVNAKSQFFVYDNMISIPVDADNNYMLEDIKFNPLKFKEAGSGFAFDIGATYKPLDKLTLALAFNDIGNLTWNAPSVIQGVSNSSFSFAGFSDIDMDSLSLTDDKITALISDAQGLIQFKKEAVNEAYNELIPFTMHLSAEYALVKSKNFEISLGLLWNHYNTTTYKGNYLVSALNIKPFSWFTISGTAQLLGKNANRYGLALNFSPRWINLYVASDYITPKLNSSFLPISGESANISLGGSFVLGKSKYREK